MKILIIAQYFWPENFNINEVAVYLKEKGHEVSVLTGQPNYPEGKFYPGYSFSKPKSEFYYGLEIFRLPTIPRGQRNAFKLILNYLFFPFIGRFRWKHLLKNKSFDIVFVCQQSPVFVGLLGARISKKLKIPMVMWVLDLWPESI
ncbi:MAG: glycosyltransferase, partial [Bacteroidia bacterium]|nr:glycosyltransferase [Bacteroidia bacterium]